MTQAIDIRMYLEAGYSLTQLEAIKRFKCMRLAARINQLGARVWILKRA